MRLALMELDRENGVDVGDGLSSADRLAGTSMPKRRRRDAESDARAGQGSGRGPWPRERAAARPRHRGRGGRRCRRRRKRAGLGRCYRGCSRGQERLSRARGPAAPAAEPRRWHEPHVAAAVICRAREREDAFRAAAAREAGAVSKGPSASDAPADKGGKSRGEGEARAASAPSPFLGRAAEAPQCPPWPIRSRMARSRSRAVVPEMAGGAAAKVSHGVARDEREPRGDRGGEGSADQGQSAVAVAVPASRARMVARARPRLRPHPTTARRRITPASGFSPPCSGAHGVS